MTATIAPSGDDTLTPANAVDVLEELLPAQTQSYVLGLKLGLPFHEVERIRAQYSDPRDGLLHTLIAFAKQAQPRPTWRVIVDALRSPAINLPHLAERVEAAHFRLPDPTSIRASNTESVADVSSPVSCPTVNLTHRVEATHSCGVPETTDASSVAVDVAPKTKTFILSPVAQVEVKIKGFRKRFNAIKESTIRCLERCCITVMTAVFVLTSIRAVDEHRVFLEEKHKSLFECKHLLELFSLLNLYWNYLAYNLLDQFIEELTLKDDCFESVAGEMAEYKKDMQDFRKSTTLELFCQAQSERTGNDPPPGFKKIIVKHNWPQTVTLEYVEKFRQCFGCEYNLQKCAMMLHSIRTGSITVIWFVPDNVVEIVKMHEPQDVYRKFKVSRLEIADNCVYQSHQEPPSPSSSHGSLSTGSSSVAGCVIRQEPPSPSSSHGSLFTGTSSVAGVLLSQKMSGIIPSRGYYISDANASGTGGQLTMDPHTGLLGLTDGKGDAFYVIQRRRLVDASGRKAGECFSLQSSTNQKLYLALNTNSPSKFTIQGMTTGEMGPISNSYWRYIMFSEIGYSPPGSGYVALQYWGNHFGPPHENPYYFVIIPKSSVPFKIAPKDIASTHGCLGVKESS